jgi:hypothetical protein
MRELWEGAGFTGVETRRIEVQRTFDSFEEWWSICLTSAGAGARIREQAADVQQELKERLRAKIAADAQGRVTLGASANAVKGRRG